MYAKIESERLRFIRLNQKKLRVEDYIHLRDAINSDGNINKLGKPTILPSSFTGGPRYMHERTQDAMTNVRNFGRPDLFITFTCNPQWKEITDELMARQKSHDRHDLIGRVFHLKLNTLTNLINKGKIFRTTRCFIYTVEWQKRGLPHAHILLWLQEKIHVHKIDDLISAELPNPESDPMLHGVIKTQMIHGPCGSFNPLSPCMKEGKCTKRYPGNFLKDTQTGHDGYPLYRRRKPEDGGYVTTKKVRGSEVGIDNRWIVPFCPLLTRAFNAHINVEYCSSIKSIKYVCKYINKGSDMAVFNLAHNDTQHDEVQLYEIGRYLSSNEAVWRILGFPIHERHPTVIHLNTTVETNQAVDYPTEFLNSLEPSGIPAHKLELKIGAPIMLLRNLDPPALCNGTRLIVKKLMPNVIEAVILTGHSAGKDVFIPRIPHIPSDVPFEFKRLQFPVRLSFAMSINKSQGQSLKVVGLDLQRPCFSHGQLYVGCSRLGDDRNLHILAPHRKTKNIIYTEILQE
ncbi:hypothetical protein AVEN_68853-1 [Araneus ventricosus]|uniref:Uncharacterized protein n=1 Tax=Araneus ventricosus TaxID=182803 RepID=A0A4Y2C696_ARAVE|nr:hypothetical protein AVEN_68853-1 [Araneus ventricosus]